MSAQIVGRFRWFREWLQGKPLVRGLSSCGLGSQSILMVAGLLAAALGVRLAASALIPLVPEEAYYWMYSQHPSLSYYDHPPMVAWLIGLGTSTIGHSEFGVRIGGALLMLAASGLMFLFGRMWFGSAAAVAAAILMQVLPIYYGAGLIATMDSALVFFWLLGLVGVSIALRQGRGWGWYLAGLGLGGAMLSKYTGIFIGFGALVAVVVYRPWRWHLRTLHPYAGALLGALLFAPVVIWNSRNQWVSFRFQFADRFEGQSFNVWTVLTFAALQLLVATPFVLAAAGWLYARTLRSRRRLLTPRWLIAVAFSLPLLGAMSYKSLSCGIHLNWTLPLYLSLLPAIFQLCLAGARLARRKLRRSNWLRAGLATALVCAALDVAVLMFVLVIEPRVHLIAAVGPWRELAAAVEKVADRLEAETGRTPLVIGQDKYRLASVLAFYRTPLEHKTRASDYTTSQNVVGRDGIGFAYWAKPQLWADRDCVIVYDKDDTSKSAPHFKNIVLVERIRLGRATYQIAIGRGLHLASRGGEP